MIEIQGWDTWAEKYKPKPNKFSKQPDELMYETFGQEVEFVQAQDPRHVWTYVDGDMSSLLLAGYHYVNRLGYYVTEIPWEDDNEYALLSVEKECECYDEESGEGKEDCLHCEGYGLVTEYVG
jgi:hypothetical protein